MRFHIRRFVILVVAVLTCAIAAKGPCFAQAELVELSIKAKKTYVLNEPMVVAVVLTNKSRRKIIIDDPFAYEQIDHRLTGPDGQQCVYDIIPNCDAGEGAPKLTFQPGGCVVSHFNLSGYYGPKRLGNFALTWKWRREKDVVNRAKVTFDVVFPTGVDRVAYNVFQQYKSKEMEDSRLPWDSEVCRRLMNLPKNIYTNQTMRYMGSLWEGPTDKAIMIYRELLKADDFPMKAGILLGIARKYIEVSKYEQAAVVIAELRRDYPESYEAHTAGWGEKWSADKRAEQAAWAAEQARLYPPRAAP